MTAAIIGTSMSSNWFKSRLPSQMMWSQASAGYSPLISGPRPPGGMVMKASAVPVSTTTRLSRSDAMAANSSQSSAWGKAPQTSAPPRECMRSVSTPAASRVTSAVLNLVWYSASFIGGNRQVGWALW